MTRPTRRFGLYDVATLLDGGIESSTDLLVHRGGAEARRQLIDDWKGEKISFCVNCYLLRGANGITLIDAGTGNAWGPGLGKARELLRAEGIRPCDIDRVLLTHIHGDHALGLFEDGAAWLPRAEILVPERDLAYFTDHAMFDSAPEARRGAFNIASSLLDTYAGRVRAIPDGPVAQMPGIEAISLPGHTAGHTGYRLEGADDSLLIWGDALHLLEMQLADPDAGMAFDADSDMAAKTRWRLLERVAREGWTVTGNHITGMGRIERRGQAFHPVWEQE